MVCYTYNCKNFYETDENTTKNEWYEGKETRTPMRFISHQILNLTCLPIPPYLHTIKSLSL